MHVNPCGRAIDWIQFPFEVDARLHDAPDAPVVRQRWLFTDQPFLPVGTGCVFMNRIWDGDDAPEYRLGMLPPAINNYEQDARWHLTPGLSGKHICNKDWLVTGEPPNHLAPTQYDSNWIPTCCGVGTAGGIEIGGQTGDVFRGHPWGTSCCDSLLLKRNHTYTSAVPQGPAAEQWWQFPVENFGYTVVTTVSGVTGTARITRGVSCSNNNVLIGTESMPGFFVFDVPFAQIVCVKVTATATGPGATYTISLNGPPFEYTDGTEGGVEAGGRVGDVFVPGPYHDAAAGGLEAGGASGDMLRFTDATAGGLEAGGEVGDLPNTTDPAAGGLELGGEVGDVPNDADPARGGLEAGGSVGDLPAFIDQAAGGLEAGGSAGDLPAFIDAAAGGLEAGGSVGDLPAFIDQAAGGLEAGGSAGDVWAVTPASVRDVSQGHVPSGWTLPTRVAGDLLYAFVNVASGLPAANTGWTLRGTVSSTPSGARLVSFSRTSDGTDNAPTTSTVGEYIIYSIRDWSVLGATQQLASAAAATTINSSSVNITKGSILLRAWAGAGSFGTQTPPAGFTTVSQTTAIPNVAAGWELVPPAVYPSDDYGVGNSMAWCSLSVQIR